MNRITTAITYRIAKAAIKRSWAILNAAERHRARAERLEGWAHRLAVDDVLATLTNETLSR